MISDPSHWKSIPISERGHIFGTPADWSHVATVLEHLQQVSDDSLELSQVSPLVEFVEDHVRDLRNFLSHQAGMQAQLQRLDDLERNPEWSKVRKSIQDLQLIYRRASVVICPRSTPRTADQLEKLAKFLFQQALSSL